MKFDKCSCIFKTFDLTLTLNPCSSSFSIYALFRVYRTRSANAPERRSRAVRSLRSRHTPSRRTTVPDVWSAAWRLWETLLGKH